MDPIRFMKNYRIDIIIVLALFMLAFGIRSITSDKFPNIYGFDSYWGARQTRHLLESGFNFPYNDSITDYPYGRITAAVEVGWWGVNAISYKVLALVSGISGFDYGLFGAIASWNTAIFGSLAIPAIYLFGRVAFNRWVGLFSGLFLAVCGGHLFYSIFGHAENDGLGFTLFFLCLFAFVLAVKKRDWKAGVLTTAMFSWLGITWQSYIVSVLLVSGTVALYFLIYLCTSLVGYYKDDHRKEQMRKWMVYALMFVALSAIPAAMTGAGWDVYAVSATGISLLFCTAVEWFKKRPSIKLSPATLLKQPWVTKALIFSAVVLFIGVILYGKALITSPLGFVGIKIGETATMPDYQARMLETIAEQNPVQGANFFDRIQNLSGTFGILIWLSFAAIIFILAKLFVLPLMRKDFRYEWDLLALAFILFTTWALTTKAQTMFFLAGAVTFGAGYLLGELIRFCDFAKKALGEYVSWAKVAVASVAFLMFFSYAITIVPSAENFTYDVYFDWVLTFNWINKNLPEGSVITTWWDYGHWLNYYTGEKTRQSLDNIQDRPDIIYTVASSFTHTPKCAQDKTTQVISCDSSSEALETAELESLSILKPLKTTHIIIDKEIVGGGTGGKFGALMHIADNRIGCFQTVACGQQNDSYFCAFGKDPNTGQVVGLSFTNDEWNNLIAVNWPGTPLTDKGLSTRAFARKDSSGLSIYMSALGCGEQFSPNLNSPVLYGFDQRMFFRDPNLKHVKLVYENGWNVIYEIDWTGVPDPQNFTQWTKDHNVLK
jgi:dolichyl-diphosphooligosaccharide--protein glycosyltransferase